jgi:maltooligosyltrehalose trehalohydrolase
MAGEAPAFGVRAHATGAYFSVPAPHAHTCAVRLYEGDGRASRDVAMARARARARTFGGVFELDCAGVRPGARYRYVLDGEEAGDPFARFLPDGVLQPASVESLAHGWKHEALGSSSDDMPVYELHVGTFTPEGTYRAAATRLRDLAALGIGAVELMPVAAFAGGRGWGYDGVAHYAPFAPYGTPDDLAALIDEAHGLGLRVVLDVVYNHMGPVGNYLRRFVPDAFTTRFASPWGESPDFTNVFMREYVLGNVRYWLHDFRFDGLRLDATHTIRDEGDAHVLREIARIAHASTPRRFVIAEDERNEPALVREKDLDGIWADDFHHSVHVALTRERDGYYGAYTGYASELARTLQRGWLYCGEVYAPSGKPRGRPAPELDAKAFVYCIQNHDQIGNRGLGERLSRLTDIDGFAAASLVLLLLPMTPLLFMGQEWAATSPFLYFTDHDDELGRKITEGRRKEFGHFEAFGGEARGGSTVEVPDPQLDSTWRKSVLDWDEQSREPHARVLELYRTLLRLRAEDAVLRDRSRAGMHAWDQGDLLIVDRRAGSASRRIIANLTSATRSLDDLTRGYRLVLSSSQIPWPTPSLPAHAAVLLASLTNDEERLR